jgi:hypothetical protein
MQVECKDEPFCVKCNKSGHLSAMCAAMSRATEPFWAGFGRSGLGFVCLEVPEEELLPPAPNAVRVSLSQGILSAEQLEDELKDLVDEEWRWNVQELCNGEFATFFPSKESLRMAIRGGGLNLPNCNIHADVRAADGDPAAAERLEEIWVKLFDVPLPYRQPVRLLLAARELGRPIGVDDQSLELADAPVRLLVGCRSPVQLPSHIVMFVNSQGFKVRVQVEGAAGAGPSAPPPPPNPTLDDKEEEGEESEGEGWDGRRGKHIRKDKESSAPRPGTNGAPKHKSVAVGLAADPQGKSAPTIPASALSQYGSNLMGKGDIFPILKSMLTPGEGSASSQVVAEDTEGDQPPLSPSLLTDSATPDGLVTPDRDGRTEGKAWHLSQEERAEVGLSPSWDSDPNLMREKERRSKSNMDRPSLVRGKEGKEVAIQLVFEEGE